ncbi:hypothetical protein ACLOJK_038889, partial [Asimina triloba]
VVLLTLSREFPRCLHAGNDPSSRKGWGGDAYPDHQFPTGYVSSYFVPDTTQPILKDLAWIKDCYDVPSNIVLSAPELDEMPLDYRPGHSCLHDGGTSGFPCFPNARCSSFLEDHLDNVLVLRMGGLSRRLGYVMFTRRGDVKTIDNSLDPTQGRKSRFFFAREAGDLLVANPDVFSGEEFLYWCGTSTRLVAAVSVPSLLEAERKKGHLCKRARSSIEGDSLVEPCPSSEGLSELLSLEWTPLETDLGEEREVSLPHDQVSCLELREAELLYECKAALSKVSRAKVMCLQASLREGGILSLAVVEYLHNDIHHHREEFERSHYFQSGLHMCGRPWGESAGEVFVPLYSVDPLVETRHE